MSTETVIAPGSEQETAQAEPEQGKPAVAPGDEANAPDQSQDSEEAKETLTDEQKTIRKLQRRIERLSGKVGGTARERDLVAQERDALRSEVSTLKGGDDTQQPEQNVEEIAERKAREILRVEKLNELATQTLTKGKKLEGFNEALESLRDEIPFIDAKKRPTPFFEALLEADNAAKLIHYLGTNPEEAAEFEGLSPSQIGRRLAKLESRLDGDAKAKTSSAPVPLRPVRGTAPDSGGLDEPGLSDSEWIRRREKAIRSR